MQSLIKKPVGHTGAFGSKAKRFSSKLDQTRPPPSTAPASIYDVGRARKLFSRAARPNSVFVSTTGRFSHVSKPLGPPPGKYYSEVKWGTQSRRHHSLSQSAFNSTVPRWQRSLSASDSLGPGAYDISNLRSSNSSHCVFASDVPRFSLPESQTAEIGPGWYNATTHGHFLKKSFNITVDSRTNESV